MKATTVNQFATRADALAYAIESLGGKAERLRKLALWMLKQASPRKAFDMDVREFMAGYSERVREAAREVWINARALLSMLQAEREAESKAAAKRAPRKAVRKAVRKAAPKKGRTDLMSDEDYAEMLQRMDPFEAARIQREE